MAAFLLTSLLVIAAFAVDLAAWYQQADRQQQTADVASLNGVLAYEAGVRDYISSVNEESWDDLTSNESQAAEQEGMSRVIDSVSGILASAGFENTEINSLNIAYATWSTHADLHDADSVAVLSTDNATITVTRTWAQIDVQGGGTAWSRTLEVVIAETGEQYFSNIVRSAPTITRAGESVMGSCGAVCARPVVVQAPFEDFSDTTTGDGWVPIPWDRDLDGIIDELWSVNHHTNVTGLASSTGGVACFNVHTKQLCTHNATNFHNGYWDHGYWTATWPMHHMSGGGNLYFSALKINSGSTQTGIVCYDIQELKPCTQGSGEFFPLWYWSGFANGATGPQHIPITGPHFDGEKLWAVIQDGRAYCVKLNMAACGTSQQNLAGRTNMQSVMPVMQNNTAYTNQFIQLDRGSLPDRIYVVQGTATGTMYSCFEPNVTAATGINNVSNGNIYGSNACGYYFDTSMPNPRVAQISFPRINTAGAHQGICTINVATSNRRCLTFALNVAGNQYSNLDEIFENVDYGSAAGDPSKNLVAGYKTTPNNERTYFATNAGKSVVCFDWTTTHACDDGPDSNGEMLIPDGSYTGIGWSSQTISPYGFGALADDCWIGLSHASVMFSFNPITFEKCSTSESIVPVTPCGCMDTGLASRYGTLRLPQSWLNKVNSAQVTVSDTNSISGAALSGYSDIDLKASDGVLDLSGIDGSIGTVYLIFDVDYKLTNGVPQVQDDITLLLEITASPTLIR